MKRKRMPIPQWEFGFSAETFNLMQESGIDGERIARERREAEQNHELANAAQEKLFSQKQKTRTVSKSVSRGAVKVLGRVVTELA